MRKPDWHDWLAGSILLVSIIAVAVLWLAYSNIEYAGYTLLAGVFIAMIVMLPHFFVKRQS